jgi:Transposase IS66 family
LLKLETALWLFVRVDDVEPTNNAAERAIRPAVIWRMHTPFLRNAPRWRSLASGDTAGQSPTRRGFRLCLRQAYANDTWRGFPSLREAPPTERFANANAYGVRCTKQRGTSFGSDSAAGSEFVSCLLAVVLLNMI